VARPWTVPTLLKTLSHTTNHKVRFIETNHIASLNRPVHMHGTMKYIPPDTLVMTQSGAHKGVYRIVGDRLFVNDAARGVPVRHYPAVMAIVSGFEGLLSGNYALLAHDFSTRLEGRPEAWRLTLKPRLASLKKALIEVIIDGRGGTLIHIQTRAPNGDFSDMHILP